MSDAPMLDLIDLTIQRYEERRQPIVPKWLTPKQVSAYCGISTKRLQDLRFTGEGPTFYKLAEGKGGGVRYKPADVDAWIEGKGARQ